MGEGNGTPLQHSCLENPMDRGAWWATVHGVAKSWTQLSVQACKYYYYCQFTDEKTEDMQDLIIHKGHTVTEW